MNEGLKFYFRRDAPAGYEAWLDRNLSYYDPISRGWRPRDNLSSKLRGSRSFKCWDERCLHYVYGFPSQEERDQHGRDHLVSSKRDSGLSVGGTPPVISEHPAHHRNYSNEYSKNPSPLYLPRPSGSLQLSTPPVPGHPRDPRDSLRSYSFISEPASSVRDPRGSVDSEVDPLLPPLKRSRVGQSRLESIGELRLLRDFKPCLRCRMARKGVSFIRQNVPCLLRAVSNGAVRLKRPMLLLPGPGRPSLWRLLGCPRLSQRTSQCFR